MEKQHLAIADPAGIINALAAQLATAQYLLDDQRDENRALSAEIAALRADKCALQKEIDDNARAYRTDL